MSYILKINSQTSHTAQFIIILLLAKPI